MIFQFIILESPITGLAFDLSTLSATNLLMFQNETGADIEKKSIDSCSP